MSIVLAAAAFAIWAYLIFARGAFWRVREEPAPATDRTPSIAVVIPARDEAETIGRALRSLLQQDYSGEMQIFVVDDHSTDETAQIAAATGPVHVVTADALPPGWTGKLWAVHCGLREAARIHPDYYLLTDADIVHGPRNLTDLVARAESGNYDLVSLMVLLRCESLAERALIPAFLFFFLKLYPPAWTARRKSNTAGAAGGCMLVWAEAFERIGGIDAIRGELIDDCALAREVKKGGAIWMGVTRSTHSIREYTTFAEIGRMISRSAYAQLRYSPLLLAGTVLGLLLTYIAAPALAVFAHGLPRVIGTGVWALMSAAYLPALLFYRRSPLWAPALPLIALFYLGATVYSAVTYYLGRGGVWKGRVQAQRSTHVPRGGS